ncbi:MAG: hypothetical protein JST84_26920 [Acidobacteria bacterium]|nr:hypothetical protein [Acidobacteriota bacterium]
MLRTTLKNSWLPTSLLFLAGILMIAFSFSSFTQAQSNAKKPTLKDAVERVGPNQIRAKSGFKLIPIDDGWAVEQIVGKETRRLEARVKCGSCPGGTCRSRLNGSCVPRNSCTSSGCLIDPF